MRDSMRDELGTPKKIDRSTFQFNALGKLSISDAALTAAIGRNRRPSWQISPHIILPIPPHP
jgi:hypothetical protein